MDANTNTSTAIDFFASFTPVGAGWTMYGNGAAERRACDIAKGEYQLAVLAGNEAFSGSTLKGKAAKWGSSYARSRKALRAKLEAAGLHTALVAVERRNVLAIW